MNNTSCTPIDTFKVRDLRAIGARIKCLQVEKLNGKPVGGTCPSEDCSFTVGPSGSCARFLNVQDAVDAAERESYPVCVHILPGTYIGDVRVAKTNIHLRGCNAASYYGPFAQGGSVLRGDVVVDVPGNAVNSIANLTINGQLRMEGSGSNLLWVNDAEAISDQKTPCVLSNTDVVVSRLIATNFRCILEGNAVDAPAIWLNGGASLEATGCQFYRNEPTGAPNGANSYSLLNQRASGGGNEGVLARDCRFIGQVRLQGASSFDLSGMVSRITTSGQACIDRTGSTGFVVLFGPFMSRNGAGGGPGPAIDGGSTSLVFFSNVVLQFGATWAAGDGTPFTMA